MTQMSFNRKMVEQTTIHPFQGIILSNKRQWSVDSCNNCLSLQGIMLNGKKPIRKGYILHDSTYSNSLNDKIQKWGADQQLPKVWKERLGSRDRQVWQQKDNRRNPCGDGIVLYLDCINVNILTVILCQFYKLLPLGKT